MQQLNQELPPTSDGSVLQKVALSTAFGGTQSSFNLNDMTLLLDESTITGSLAVSDLATLASQFTLNVDTINADRYLAPASGESAASDADATALPQDELQALRVQGSITIGQLARTRLQLAGEEVVEARKVSEPARRFGHVDAVSCGKAADQPIPHPGLLACSKRSGEPRERVLREDVLKQDEGRGHVAPLARAQRSA